MAETGKFIILLFLLLLLIFVVQTAFILCQLPT